MMPGKGLNLPHGVKGEEGVVQPPAALALGEGWMWTLGGAEPSMLGNPKSQAQCEPKGQGLPPPYCDTEVVAPMGDALTHGGDEGSPEVARGTEQGGGATPKSTRPQTLGGPLGGETAILSRDRNQG